MVGGEGVQDRVIAIGGLESAYMRKFVMYLNNRLGKQARIGIVENPDQIKKWDPETIWIGSEAFIQQVRSRLEDPRCIILSEEVSQEECVICRYQSCERIFQKIMFLHQGGGNGKFSDAGNRQKWIAVTGDCTVSQLLAFSVTMAHLLAGRERVLYLNLSECSGMGELFLMEPGPDLSDFVLELRCDEKVSTDAFVRRLEQIDCILPPENPMILHEIRGDDVEKLMRTVRSQEQYGAVVIALGCLCCGSEFFFRQASAVYHLTREGESFSESRRAWKRLIGRCLKQQKVSVTQVSLPVIAAESEGIHLIYEWAEGSLGRLARKYLRGEEEPK